MLLYVLCFVFVVFVSKGLHGARNFVFILTDDQDLTLSSMNYMKNAVNLIANKGITFNNFFVNSPICCPSRSTILTGLYPHNTLVFNNSIEGGCSSFRWQKSHENSTVAAILKNQKNYKTFYAGKYLNQYGSKGAGGTGHVPPGYDWWIGLEGNSKYYNYTLSINGTGKFFANEYLTDKITHLALEFLNQTVASTENFFMMLAPPACHAPFTPAPRHRNIFPELITPRNLPFNVTPINKHWIVEMPPKSLPASVNLLDSIYRNRIRTLQAVDEMIGAIIEKLEDIGVINNTYVIMTSDNGFHIGQFTQPWDKRQPYESDIRAPLLIRGPGIASKTVSDHPVAAVDITPTILDLVDVEINDFDGVSFKEQLYGGENCEKYVLIEYWGEGDVASVDILCPWGRDTNLAECMPENWCKCQDSRNNTYLCFIRLCNKEHFKFCAFVDGFVEAYNLDNDPHELNNLNLTQGEIDDNFAILKRLRHCRGRSCQIKC